MSSLGSSLHGDVSDSMKGLTTTHLLGCTDVCTNMPQCGHWLTLEDIIEAIRQLSPSDRMALVQRIQMMEKGDDGQ